MTEMNEAVPAFSYLKGNSHTCIGEGIKAEKVIRGQVKEDLLRQAKELSLCFGDIEPFKDLKLGK